MTDSFNAAPIQAWKNCRLLTGVAGLGVIADGMILAQNGGITYAGPANDVPRSMARLKSPTLVADW